MPKVVSRPDWQARQPRKTRPWPGAKKGVAVHWTWKPNPASSPLGSEGQMRGIQNYHMDNKGWWDIAYNFLVDQFGVIYVGRGWNHTSGAQGTRAGNRYWLAICWIGGEDGAPPSAAALASLSWLINEAQTNHGFGPEVRPHKSFKAKPCPGPDLIAWINVKGWVDGYLDRASWPAWAVEAIEAAVDSGAMVGSNKLWEPDAPVTRAQLAVVLKRLGLT